MHHDDGVDDSFLLNKKLKCNINQCVKGEQPGKQEVNIESLEKII